MSKKSFIDAIEVKNPCSEQWSEMAGNEKIRFCSHCAKSVNNLSEMTRKDALRLVRRSGGNLCVRYIKDTRTNTPMFAATLHQIARRTGVAAGVLGTSLMLSAAAYSQGETIDVQTIRAAQQINTDGAVSKLSGYVTDPNGAVIPYAIVSATNEATLESHIMNASAEGFYEFAGLSEGLYKLKVEAGGFDGQEIINVSVRNGSESGRNARMAIQHVEEVVQVGGTGNVETWGTVGLIVTTVSYEKRNLLVEAVMNEDFEQVKIRIAKRANVNATDKAFDGMSPLHAAVETGNFEIAQYLLAYGAKPNSRDFQKRTPLMMLDEDASPELFQLLVSYGAKIQLTDKQRNTVLHHFAEFDGKSEFLRTMIAHGASVNAVNKEGKTALMIASENGSTENVRTLIESGANVNAPDKQKKTAWHMAENEEIKNLLRTYGAVAEHD